MDPEDLRDLITAYQTCVAETVRRHGGFVAKYLGDGVPVYFGYPQAHEDDAEQAVRAGLETIAMRLCCCRVVGVHMANPKLGRETSGITAGAVTQPFSKTALTSRET